MSRRDQKEGDDTVGFMQGVNSRQVEADCGYRFHCCTIRISTLKETQHNFDTTNQARNDLDTRESYQMFRRLRNDPPEPQETLNGGLAPTLEGPAVSSAERIDKQSVLRHDGLESFDRQPYEQGYERVHPHEQIQTGSSLDASQTWEGARWDGGGAYSEGLVDPVSSFDRSVCRLTKFAHLLVFQNAMSFAEEASQAIRQSHEPVDGQLRENTILKDREAVGRSQFTIQTEEPYHLHLPLGSSPTDYETLAYSAPDTQQGASNRGVRSLESQRRTNTAISALPETRPTNQQGVGTLLIGRAGRSKFLGPTAGSDWLHDVSMSSTRAMALFTRVRGT
jgi:hypothetical protein